MINPSEKIHELTPEQQIAISDGSNLWLELARDGRRYELQEEIDDALNRSLSKALKSIPQSD